METTALVERLLERLRESAGIPASEVVVEELWLAVVDGSLDPGQRLPTARQLAITLNVSPRSIERAYEELERRGVMATRTGAGTFVSLQRPESGDLQRHREFAELCRETIRRARELGFDVDDVLDTIREHRAAIREDPATESV